jgi:hypothetical protein
VLILPPARLRHHRRLSNVQIKIPPRSSCGWVTSVSLRNRQIDRIAN